MDNTETISHDEEGNVENFTMSNKYAPSPNEFLCAVTARLEISTEELKKHNYKSTGTPLLINSICTVLTESKIISLLGNEQQAENILGGIHYSIAKRVINPTKKVEPNEVKNFAIDSTLNKGLAEAIEFEFEGVTIPKNLQISTALGASNLKQEVYEKL